MADNFFSDATSDKPEVIKLGDKEYTQEELNAKVGLADKITEFETKQGQKFDEVVKSWGQRGERIGEMKKQLEDYEKEKAEAAKKPANVEWTEEMRAQAKSQLEDLLGGKPMTDKELENWYSSRRAGEKLLEECDDLKGEIDGTDGRPKFATEDILKHMTETGIRNPMKAYKDKYETELEAWTKGQLSAAKGTPAHTMGNATSSKEPSAVKITKDNLGALVSEALYGTAE